MNLKLLYKLLFIVLVIFGGTLHVQAQNFPVQVNTQIVPPFSPYLNDYTAIGAQRFIVNLLIKDLTIPEYRCKLRLTIEGVGITIRTKQNFIPRQALVLTGGGVPNQVYGEDIEEYFNPANLDFAGISRAQYQKGGKLPEGVYRFSIEVVDYNRNTVVSNKGTTTAWIILNDPPILNLPRTNTKARIIDPTNIPFTWTPRHTGSPNSAFTTEYTFRLVEIWPVTRNPYDAFLSQQPLYEVVTNSTQIVYGMAEPALIPGRKYAWQVQAKDVDGRDLFKNQGKSEVYVFQFGDALGAPENFRLQTANPSSLTVRWDQPIAGSETVTYRVRYRPVGNDGQWYEDTTEDQWRTVVFLQPDKDYEMQVRAEQNFQFSDYSAIRLFKTKSAGADDFACNADVQPPPLPANANPLFKLGINDTIRAGGYDVVVRKVSGSNGSYTGEGVAIVPWFMSAKVKVTFDKINVNEQFWLTSGTIKSVWNADSKFLIKDEKKVDPAKAPDAGNQSTNIVETETLIQIKEAIIVSVTKNEDGDVVVETSSGESQVVPKGTSASIVDDAGNGYLVDKEGNIAKTTATAAMDAYKKGQRDYNMQLQFAKGAGKFGFDEKQHDVLASYYQQLEEGAYIPWKAVSMLQPDGVDAVLQGTAIAREKVRFEMGGSVITPSDFADNIFKLSLSGKAQGAEEELVAYYQESDAATQQVIGKLNLVSYDKITKNIVIVPVNMDLPNGLSAPNVKAGLEAIYEQAVAYWQVGTADRINVTFDQAFDDGESGTLSNYTPDMRKVISAYGVLQDQTYYLFVINNNTASGTNAYGYMPRSKQAGFIFAQNLSNDPTRIIRTMAHELGHGVFNLKHTFSEFLSLAKGTTPDNLMDYPSGNKLYKYQWDYVHDPQRVIPLFEDDEEGRLASMTIDVFDESAAESLTSLEFDTALDEVSCGEYTFLTKWNRLITLSKEQVEEIRQFKFSGRFLESVVTNDEREFVVSRTSELKDIQPQEIKGEVVNKEVKSASVSLVCWSCVKKEESGKMVVKEYQSNSLVTGYKIGAEYKLTIARQEACAEGKIVIVGISDDKKPICDKVSSNECEGNGNGNGQSNTTVRNFTKRAIENEAELSKLLAGLKPKDTDRHLSKAILFLTDEDLKLTEPLKYKYVEEYEPKGDTIKIWLHHDSKHWTLKSNLTDNANKLASYYSNNKFTLNVNDLISSYKDSEADKIATALYEFFDWVAKGVEKAKIPEYIWNCDKPDEYQAIYATVYGWVTAPLKPVRLLVQAQFKALLDKDPKNAALLQKLQNPEGIELAAICGLWDGLVDIVAGVPKMLSVIAGLGSTEGWTKMSNTYNTLTGYNNIETGRVGIMGALTDGLASMFNPNKPCELAHNASGVVVGIALCFINPAAIEGTFGKVISNFVKIVQTLDNIAGMPGTIILGAASKMTFKVASGIVSYTFKNGALLVRVARKIGDPLSEIDWSRVVTKAELVTSTGERVWNGQIFVDGSELNQAIFKIKKIIKDEKGDIFKDVNGNGLAELEDGSAAVIKVGEEGSEAATKFAALFKNKPALKTLFDNLPDAVRKNFDGLTENTLDKILTLLNTNPKLLKALNETPEIAKLWTKHKNNFSADELENALNAYAEAAREMDDATKRVIDDLADESGMKQRMLERFEKGRKFEQHVRSQLLDKTSAAYKKLKQFIPDLDQREILYQVYFCISGKHPCNDAGEYFIADFACVKKNVDEFTKEVNWDVVIADSKLSRVTDFSPNQNTASELNAYILKTPATKIDGKALVDDAFKPGSTVIRSTTDGKQLYPFYKIYSDGNGTYSNIQ